MPQSHFIILYVDQPAASAAFYEKLLAKAPVESSPTFALFALDDNLMLGLWSRHTVAPAPSAQAGGGELALTVGSKEQVDAICETWREAGVRIAQAPVSMDFGYTFVGLDPDSHRLRVFAPH